jgi:uncharacterized protein YbjT (DUF2867 family)
MSRYVIAGATGHVGSVAAGDLLAQGEKVTVVVRDAERGIPWSERGAELAVGGLQDSQFLAGALRAADGFLAVLPEIPAAEDLHRERRRMADAIAAAVRESGVPQVVMISSLGAELDTGTGPISDLHYLENALRSTGVPLRAIRASYFQENVAFMIGPVEQAGIYPNLLQSSDTEYPTVATRDVGRLAAQLLVSRPPATEVVDLLGPRYSTRDFATALGAALGRPAPVVDVPPAGRVDAILQSGVSPSVAAAYAEMFDALGAGRITVPRGDRVVRSTTTLEETLRSLRAPRPA